MKLSQDLQISLSVALSEAARLRHEYAVVEHLLYALTLDRGTSRVLAAVGADVERLRRRLAAYLAEELEPLSEEGESASEPRLSLALQRTLSRASLQVESAGRDEVLGSDLLVALFAEPASYAVDLLHAEGVDRLDVVSHLAHGAEKAELLRPWTAARGEPTHRPEEDDDEELRDSGPVGDPLETFAQDLTALAGRGALDPLIGRERELARTLHILQRRRKNNPVYVGDPGVGKTALVEGLAWKIARGEVPEPFRATRVFRLDLGALLAGTRYRGDFENRMKAVIAALDRVAREEGIAPLLFIDEIHTVIGAGSAGHGTLDASSLLKPALAGGALRVLGATTWDEYRQVFLRDQALSRRFQKVEVAEASVADTVKIFDGLRDRYESHHGVRYARAAVAAAAELADRHLRDRRNPDKAIDLLDEAGAAVALRGGRRVGTADVERVLATMTGVPLRRVAGSDRDRLAHLADELASVVFGQDQAIERLVSAIKVARAGLRDRDKPTGSFLLTGPTGVGKTEMARQLAAALGIAFLRFDMSEYMERHTVSRLVGAPPGYVGFDRGGLLTEAVAKSPHAVLLLDEIEKAHDDVFNLLLQVMDHGTLTDTNGKATDFRHVILLMTSNLGAREMARRGLGFGEEAADGRESEGDRAVERRFSPEFRNRLDGRLFFRPLSPAVMERIVEKMVGELRAQLMPQRVEIEITRGARRLLAERGHDPAMGARPLARLLDETVKRPLTDELLFGRLTKGGRAMIAVRDGEITIAAEPMG